MSDWEILTIREISYLMQLGVKSLDDFLSLPISSLLRLRYGMEPLLLNSILNKIDIELMKRREDPDELKEERSITSRDLVNLLKFLLEGIPS